MKFGQLIEYKVSDNYLSSEITAENKTGNLVSDIFIWYLYEVKASDLQLSFSVFR